MIGFEAMSPEELVVLGAALTFLLSEGQDADDLNVLGNFVVAVGGLILSWAAQLEHLNTPKEDDPKNENGTLDELKKQIQSLQERCGHLEQKLGQAGNG